MTPKEIEQFKIDFKKIISVNAEINDSSKKLTGLHVWDKNGSHNDAIIKRLDIMKAQKEERTKLLNGHDYEEWKAISKKLNQLKLRLDNAIRQKEKAETELSNLNFK